MPNKKRNHQLIKTHQHASLKKEKKSYSQIIGRIIRRFLLVLLSMTLMSTSVLIMVLSLVFNGPSPTARNLLTMTLIEASATKWWGHREEL